MLKERVKDFTSSPLHTKVANAIEEITLGTSIDEEIKNHVAQIEKSFNKQVKAVVLISCEYLIKIYPVTNASDDSEALDFARIIVEHKASKDSDCERYEIPYAHTESALFMIYNSIGDSEEPFDDWLIDFTCF